MALTTLNALRNQATSRLGSAITSTLTSGLNKIAGTGRSANPNSPGSLNSFGGKHKFSKRTLTYPADIGTDGQGHYVVFKVGVYTPPKVAMTNAKAVLGDVIGKAVDDNVGNGNGGSKSGNKKADGQKEGATEDKKYANAAEMKAAQKKGEAAAAKSRKQIGAGATKKHHTDHIALYMPPQVQVQYTAGYAEQEIGILSEIGSDVILGMMNATPGGFMGIGNTLSAGFKKAKSSFAAGGSQALLEYGLKTLDTVTILPGMEGAKAIAQMNMGKVFAPRMELMFEGMGRRSFNFTFTFIPKDEQEAITVHNIVDSFKHNMSSKFLNGQRMQTIPNVFDIEYMCLSGENTFLNKIGTSVLKSVDVTYGGDRYQAYDSSAETPPQRTTIALAFTELEILDRDMIDQGY